jgi:hypothetical protein
LAGEAHALGCRTWGNYFLPQYLLFVEVGARRGDQGVDCHAEACDLRMPSRNANCFPMMPSEEARNNMLMGDDLTEKDLEDAITEDGKVMV